MVNPKVVWKGVLLGDYTFIFDTDEYVGFSGVSHPFCVSEEQFIEDLEEIPYGGFLHHSLNTFKSRKF